MVPASRDGAAGGPAGADVQAGSDGSVNPVRPAVWQAGLVVSKAVGNSVVRHRVARRLRAILAGQLPRLAEPKRVVVRALPAAASADYGELERAVGRCLRKATR
ncbi:MAG: ribonuclease P protein component [Bifidobacteriaceae bacterium]|nr:ribonuclease P protein component [Bifidobacteriaceae bacterium]